MKSNYDRSISLICPTCAASDFTSDEAEPAVYVCNGCGLAISRQSLMDSNQERLSEAVKELKNEVVSDISKDLKAVIKSLKVK